MKKLLLILLTTSCLNAYAGDFLDPWGRHQTALPASVTNPDGSVTINPSWERLYGLGWRKAELLQYPQVQTNRIQDDIRIAMVMWKVMAERYWGEGAHLNPALTESNYTAAIVAMLPRGEITPEAVGTLEKIRTTLRSFHFDHFSTLPYGKTEIVTTNVLRKWIATE